MGSHRHREPCSPQVSGTQVQRDTNGHNVRRLQSLRPAARKNNARNQRLGRSSPHRQSILNRVPSPPNRVTTARIGTQNAQAKLCENFTTAP